MSNPLGEQLDGTNDAVHEFTQTTVPKLVKRVFDIIAASAGLTIFAPLLLAIAVLIKLDSVGPVFYRGVRIGQFGRPFKILKLRTMVVNAELLGGTSTGMNDTRITRIGRVLRRSKLDELPQLINVLIGEMSIVGPRPEVEEYTRLYEGEEKKILFVCPGITDLASLQFICLDEALGNENVDNAYKEKVRPIKNRLRLQYVSEQTFWGDMKIIYRTLCKLLALWFSWNTRNLANPH